MKTEHKTKNGEEQSPTKGLRETKSLKLGLSPCVKLSLTPVVLLGFLVMRMTDSIFCHLQKILANGYWKVAT